MSWRARLSTNMQELRFNFCPLADGSTGVRNFLQDNYAIIRKLNPRFPCLIREGDGLKAQITARFDWNETRVVQLEGLNDKEIELQIKELVELGETMERSSESIPKDREIIDEIDIRLREDY